MSRGMTIAEFVQQVLYAVYKVRLDVDTGVENAWHSKSNQFKEIVMEGNFVLQELQKDLDWTFLRDRWEMGITTNNHGIQEFKLPPDVYKVCTGYNDAVRLHPYNHGCPGPIVGEIPWTQARSGSARVVDMFDEWGNINAVDNSQMAFTVGDIVTFKRPWFPHESGLLVETDVIRYLEPLHICDDNCPDHCPKAYENRVFTEIPDPYWMVVRTAAKRAEADPDVADRVQSLTDEANKMISAMRENDQSHTTTDTYRTAELGYVGVL